MDDAIAQDIRRTITIAIETAGGQRGANMLPASRLHRPLLNKIVLALQGGDDTAILGITGVGSKLGPISQLMCRGQGELPDGRPRSIEFHAVMTNSAGHRTLIAGRATFRRKHYVVTHLGLLCASPGDAAPQPRRNTPDVPRRGV